MMSKRVEIGVSTGQGRYHPYTSLEAERERDRDRLRTCGLCGLESMCREIVLKTPFSLLIENLPSHAAKGVLEYYSMRLDCFPMSSG